MNMKTAVLIAFLVQCFFSVDISGSYAFPENDFIRGVISELKIFDSYKNLTDLENYPEVCDQYDNETCASSWFKEIRNLLLRNHNRYKNAKFNYLTDINEKTWKVYQRLFTDSLQLDSRTNAKIKKFQWKSFNSTELKKLISKHTFSVTSKNISIRNELKNIFDQISTISENGKPCLDKCLQPGYASIITFFKNEANYDILVGFWVAWRNVTGKKIRDLFIDRVKLQNIGAVENGYDDLPSAVLNHDFEEDNFKETIMRLYNEILPFYKELHAFVRHCLVNYYPLRFDIRGPIPAHILGDPWGEQWSNIFPIIQNYYGSNSNFDYLKEANKALENVSVHQMFQMAEKFYESMGMPKMTDEFWERSDFTQQMNKSKDCSPLAYDFSNGKDYRISMCAESNFNDFLTIHSQMAHIQYYMAYKNLSMIHLESTYPGFHEAISNTIDLSVRTPYHLKEIGLISNFSITNDSDIDYLMTMALEKVVLLSFAITVDTFIWSVYNGSVPMSKLNEYWWNLRYKFQGLKPPVERSEKDFDPGSKYHIAFGTPNTHYFVSFLIQFQLYEAMCNISGHVGPLHRCDFYQSKTAGSRMLEMLKQRQEQHWRKTIKILIGQDSIKSESLLKYFEPLHMWLISTNKRLNISVGW